MMVVHTALLACLPLPYSLPPKPMPFFSGYLWSSPEYAAPNTGHKAAEQRFKQISEA